MGALLWDYGNDIVLREANKPTENVLPEEPQNHHMIGKSGYGESVEELNMQQRQLSKGKYHTHQVLNA